MKAELKIFLNIFLTATSLATSYLNLSKAVIASGTNFLFEEFAIVFSPPVILQLEKTFAFSNTRIRKKKKNKQEIFRKIFKFWYVLYEIKDILAKVYYIKK